jgi:hypothetical protein
MTAAREDDLLAEASGTSGEPWTLARQLATALRSRRAEVERLRAVAREMFDANDDGHECPRDGSECPSCRVKDALSASTPPAASQASVGEVVAWLRGDDWRNDRSAATYYANAIEERFGGKR